MLPFKTLAAGLALWLFPLTATAQTADVTASGGTVRRLTPEQIETAKEAGASKKAGNVWDRAKDVPDRKIHGEVGFGIGTGGYRSIFGAVVAPIGDNGIVALSFENTRFNTQNGRFQQHCCHLVP